MTRRVLVRGWWDYRTYVFKAVCKCKRYVQMPSSACKGACLSMRGTVTALTGMRAVLLPGCLPRDAGAATVVASSHGVLLKLNAVAATCD